MAGYQYTEFTDHQTGSARPGEGYDDCLYEAGRDVDEAEEQIKEWLPRLWSAIQLARNTFGTGGGFIVTTNKDGRVIPNTLNNWWNDAKRAVEQKAGVLFG